MKLYHYTSIKSLAAILSSCKFRFTRLDLVDDPEEYCYTKDSIDYAKYAFVSCFTNNKYENLPQWQMYADNKHGVRIGIDENLFDIVDYKNQKYIAYPLNLYADKDYMVMPLLNGTALEKVQYVGDVSDVIKNTIYIDLPEGNALDLKAIGIYKNKDWTFLQEYRFILNVFPSKIDGKTSSLSTVLANHLYPNIRHIDMPLNKATYQRMEIMVGPETDDTEKIIVSALMEKFLGRNNFELSTFQR